MRILQILPELNVGGVETGTIDFAKYLIAQGHHSVVVSNGGRLVPTLEQQGSKHYALPVHKKSLLSVIRMVKELVKVIETENIDIVHARSRVPAWIAYFACRKSKATYVTTCHGHYKSWLFSQVMGWGKYVIVPSAMIARHMIDKYRVSSDKIRCIPRSVDLTKFEGISPKKRKSNQYTIAVVGRITPLKGHTYFFQSMAKVIRTIPYAKIIVVGDVPPQKESYRNELIALIRRLGIESKVEFLGNRDDVPKILSEVDTLVFPSVEPESFGRVVLEAQAVDVPVIATNIGGVLDIIDDEQTGLLVLPKDTDALAKAVIRLHKDNSLRESIVKNAKEKLLNQFTLEHMSSQTIRVYEELLELNNILVLKISSMGDVALVTASLKALRKKFDNAKIYCLVGKESRKVLQNCPYLDGLIIYDYKDKDRGIFGFIKLTNKLRKYNFDKIIDFQNSKKSHAICALSFPKQSFGYNNKKWGFLLSHGIKDVKKNLPPVAHQFQILEQLDISYKDNAYLDLWPTPKDVKYAKALLDAEWLGNAKNIVGINVAASEKWLSKNWPAQYIAKLCDMLSTKNVRVLLTGMEKDKALAQEVASLTQAKPAVFVGKTDIMQLTALIKMCKVYLTPDSAPLHLAAAMQVPVVALFGPTDSKRHIPPAKKIIILENKPVCAPCYSPTCQIQTHDCMNEIKPETVFKEIEQLMEVS